MSSASIDAPVLSTLRNADRDTARDGWSTEAVDTRPGSQTLRVKAAATEVVAGVAAAAPSMQLDATTIEQPIATQAVRKAAGNRAATAMRRS
jgi:hypothetical protein